MNAIRLDLYEYNTHRFIVKIWLEAASEEDGSAIWRGDITHVLSGVRQPIRSLNDIAAFIEHFFQHMEVQLNHEPRLHRIIVRPQRGNVMPEIKWKLDLEVADSGPKFTPAETLKVDAYERIDFELHPGFSQDVPIEPSDQLCLMLIMRNTPDPKNPKPDAEKLYYIVNEGNPATEKIILESNHVLIGEGIDKLIKEPPQKLTFTNNQDLAVMITVFLARKFKKKETPGSPGTEVGRGNAGGSAGVEPPQNTPSTQASSNP